MSFCALVLLAAAAAAPTHAYSSLLRNSRCDEWLAPGMSVMSFPMERSSSRRVLALRRSDLKPVACGATVRRTEPLLVGLTEPTDTRIVYAEHALEARGATFSGFAAGCDGRRAVGGYQRASAPERHNLTIDADAHELTLVGAWQNRMGPVLVTPECVLRVEGRAEEL